MENDKYFEEHKENEIKRLERKNALKGLQRAGNELENITCDFWVAAQQKPTEENKRELVCKLVRALKLVTTYSTKILHAFDIPQEMAEEEMQKPFEDKININVDNLPKPQEPKEEKVFLPECGDNNSAVKKEDCVHCQFCQQIGNKLIPYCDLHGVLNFMPCAGCVKFEMRTNINEIKMGGNNYEV